MKSIIIKKLLTLVIIILITGTIIIPIVSSNELFIVTPNKTKVGINHAYKIANTKIKQLGKSNDFSIGDSFNFFQNNEGKTLFYICDLQPKGYIVVSADYNLPPVIAYSFTNNYYNEFIENNIFIDLLKSDLEIRLSNIEYLPKNVLKSRNILWDNYLKNEGTNRLNLDFQQWPPEGTTLTEGWVETNWHQNSPYNDLCPIDPNSGNRGVAGCPAVAIAQILNYHRTINNVFFNDSDDYYHNYINKFWIDDDYQEYGFPSFPELNEHLEIITEHYDNKISITDEDKAALNFACGVAATQVYTPEISGTFGVNQAYDAYVKFNCNTVELLDDDNNDLYDRLIENIKNAYPAHLAVVTPTWDAGHNLVVDGYNTDNFYHLNFGWGGTYDGWYLLPDELPYSLTIIEGLIVDIMNDNFGSNLECNGFLSWVDVTSGSTIYGNFTVENIGESESQLNWEIEQFPDWGTWEFSPLKGENLTPEDGMILVEVSVIAPDNKGMEFNGGIKIVNKDSSGDCCYIQVSLAIPKNKSLINQHIIQWFLQNHPNVLQIIKILLYH